MALKVLHIKNTPIPGRRLWGTALSTALSLVIGIALGHVIWGIWGFMGAFASLYVQNQPYRMRAVTLALVGVGLAIAMGLGALSVVWWHMALALGFVAAAATYLTGSFDVPLPAGFMFVLVACISAASPLHPSDIVVIRVLSVLGGAGIAWLVGMMDWLWNRTGPVMDSLTRAYGSLTHYAESLSQDSMMTQEHKAAMAVMSAHRAAEAAHDDQARLAAASAQDIFRALVAVSTKVHHKLPRPYIESLDYLKKSLKAPPSHPPQALPGSRGYERLQEALEQALEVNNGKDNDLQLTAYRPTLKDQLRRGLSWDSLILPAFLRIGLAVSLSVVIARLLGLSHPFWVPLTCAAVLQGVSTVVITQRTVQRALGTTLGLVLTGVILMFHPNVLITSLLIVLLQLAMLFFIAKNYGISVVFITTLALVIIAAETHPPVWPMVWARFIDTLLGGAIGLLAAFGLWGRASSTRLPDAMAEVLTTTGHLMETLLTDKASARARSRALSKLLALRHLYDTALGEVPSLDPDRIWPELLTVERLGYLVVALSEQQVRPDVALAEALQGTWGHLARAVRGESIDEPIELPEIHRFPAINNKVHEIAELLDIPYPNLKESS